MKRLFLIFICLFLVSCSENVENTDYTFTDDLGRRVRLTAEDRVAACHASFADCWLLAGGSLVGVTSDAVEEHGIDADGAKIIGSAKTVNTEALLSSGATAVLLSADLTAHLELESTLTALGLECIYFKVDTFDDYASVMERLCCVTKREDLYVKSVTEVKERIDDVLTKLPDDDRTVLLMRVYSSGIKAKGQDNLAGLILHEYGLTNIADSHPSLLEDMSLEHIVATDPDIIFVLTMGNEEAALQYLDAEIESNPAFGGLTAVANQNYYVLPKELFHYKPNERWNESYEYLAKILYPKVFG